MVGVVGKREGWQKRKETQIVDKRAALAVVDGAPSFLPKAVTCSPLAM